MPSISMNSPQTAAPAEPQDRDLLRAYAQRQDNAAFTRFFRRHAGLVYHAAVRMGATLDQASDVVQAVMTDVARKAARLQYVENLPGWMHQASRVEMLRVRRAMSRDINRRESLQKNLTESVMQPSPPTLVESDLQAELDSALAKLSTTEQAYIFQRFYEGRSSQEIAEQNGETAAAVQKRGYRALEKLAVVLSRKKSVAVPFVIALLSQVFQQSAPASVLQNGASGLLKNLAGSAGFTPSWQGELFRHRWPLAQGAAALFFIGTAVLQQHNMAATTDATIVPKTGKPHQITAPAQLRAANFQIPASAFDAENPNLPALAEFCYRARLSIPSRTDQTRLFYLISGWFGPAGGKGLGLLEQLYSLDIPSAHRRELAAKMLEFDWIEPKQKLEWTIKFHLQDDEPGQWHDSFIRSLSNGLAIWIKDDADAAWKWARHALDEGLLGTTTADKYPYSTLEQALSSIWNASLKAGRADIANEVFAEMTTTEKSAALGDRLNQLSFTSTELGWCLEQLSHLPSRRFQELAIRNNSTAQNSNVTPDHAAQLLLQHINNWEATDWLKATFIRRVGPKESLLPVFEKLPPSTAEALITELGPSILDESFPLESFMAAAVRRGTWQSLMARMATDAKQKPGDPKTLEKFTICLKQLTDRSVQDKFISEWASAAAAKQISAQQLQQTGVSPQALSILFPKK